MSPARATSPPPWAHWCWCWPRCWRGPPPRAPVSQTGSVTSPCPAARGKENISPAGAGLGRLCAGTATAARGRGSAPPPPAPPRPPRPRRAACWRTPRSWAGTWRRGGAGAGWAWPRRSCAGSGAGTTPSVSGSRGTGPGHISY